VVHHARCPVLVLRGDEGSWPPERIVIGDDGSEASKAAGNLAAALFGNHGARSLVMRAFPQLPEGDVEGRESDARMADDEPRHEENSLMERSKELGERFGSRPTMRLAVGDASGCLLEAADEDAPERTLLVVGSRGLGAVGRMRLGSVSTKLLHAARGPVLTRPPLRDEG
ncbi:MAG: universal stress protein, partial [Rubrobacter sp.]